jgi:hypothetical protein
MKNIFKIFLSTLLVFSFGSCEDSNTVVDQVVADTQAGAVLRTIEVLSNTLNRSIPTTSFSVEVEEQDEEGGALLESVDIFVSIRDLTPDNGTTVKEALVKTIPASAFTTGPVDLPRATLSATFGEAEAAMGIDDTQHSPGDLFVFELRLNLTDGRTFGAADAAGIITGGYWASPYQYNTLLLCAPKPGEYTIDMHDSYGDGWQTDGGNGGAGIQVKLINLAGDETIVEFGMCSAYADGSFLDSANGTCVPNDGFEASTSVLIPEGTAEATWNFPGDAYAEISFEVYAPNGDLLLAVGLGEGSPGLLPVTNCLE